MGVDPKRRQAYGGARPGRQTSSTEFDSGKAFEC